MEDWVLLQAGGMKTKLPQKLMFFKIGWCWCFVAIYVIYCVIENVCFFPWFQNMTRTPCQKRHFNNSNVKASELLEAFHPSAGKMGSFLAPSEQPQGFTLPLQVAWNNKKPKRECNGWCNVFFFFFFSFISYKRETSLKDVSLVHWWRCCREVSSILMSHNEWAAQKYFVTILYIFDYFRIYCNRFISGIWCSKTWRSGTKTWSAHDQHIDSSFFSIGKLMTCCSMAGIFVLQCRMPFSIQEMCRYCSLDLVGRWHTDFSWLFQVIMNRKERKPVVFCGDHIQ